MHLLYYSLMDCYIFLRGETSKKVVDFGGAKHNVLGVCSESKLESLSLLSPRQGRKRKKVLLCFYTRFLHRIEATQDVVFFWQNYHFFTSPINTGFRSLKYSNNIHMYVVNFRAEECCKFSSLFCLLFCFFPFKMRSISLND